MIIRRITLFCTLLLMSVFLLHNQSTTASAANDAWTGHYFSNSQMQGAPVLTRSDPYLRFFWGNGKPAPEINSSDYFSARWSRTVTLDKAQRVIFTVRGDDGYRVFVDGKVLIDRLSGVPLEAASAEMNLSAGSHVFYVEYYEHIGNASIDLQYYFGPVTQSEPQPHLKLLGFFAVDLGSIVTTIPTHDFFIRYGQEYNFPRAASEVTVDGVVYSGYAEGYGCYPAFQDCSKPDTGIELHGVDGNFVSRITWNMRYFHTYTFFHIDNILYVMTRGSGWRGYLTETELRAYDVHNPWVPVEIALPDSLKGVALPDFIGNGHYGYALRYPEQTTPYIEIYNLASETPYTAISRVALPDIGMAPRIILDGNHLFVSSEGGGYHVLAIAQSESG